VNLQYHIVFSTKQRRPLLSPPDRLARICEYIGGILREQDARMLAANGAPDHVHLAVIIDPTLAVADVVRVVKANSSRWIHETFPDMRDVSWQDGYAAFSVSSSMLPKVVAYIRAQADHHKRMTFEEELIALLDRHGIEYDKRYIFA